MRHTSALWLVGLVLALAGTAACGAEGDTRPFTVVGPTAPVLSGRLTVTDGWTGAAVPQARVTVGAETTVTDAAGQFVVDTTAPCQRTTIVASGYLDRQMSCLPPATQVQRTVVTLWPVADEAERSALRELAFGLRGILARPYALSLEVPSSITNRKPVFEAWQAAGRSLETMTGGAAKLRIEPLMEDGVVLRPWSSPGECSPDFRWQAAVSQFCQGPFMGYFAYVLHVAPEFIADQHVALRALMYQQGLRPHALPGLLNATRPANTLSDFEVRTLHMVGLRAKPFPGGTSWPDTEF